MEEFFANLDYQQILDFFVKFFTELFKALDIYDKLESKLHLSEIFGTDEEE